MKPNLHQQTRQWIQLQYEGQLRGEDESRLQDHLRTCAECRAAAARLESIHLALQQAYRERSLTHGAVLSYSPTADGVFHQRMRLKMKQTQVTSFATSLLSVAVVAVAVIVFSWLISTRATLSSPDPGEPPLVPPSPTAFPWTEDHPLTSAAQVESLLVALADKHVDALQQQEWVHVVRRDEAGPGMMHSAYSESWSRYAKDGRACADSITWVQETAESSANILQLQVLKSDGTYGDLVQLRAGEGEVSHLQPGLEGCSLAPELMPAGQLAARLQQEQAASADQPVDVKAWYAAPEGRPLLTVAVTFTQPSKSNYTGISKETRSFDLETGALVQEGIRMEWPDGSVFDESLQGYETEFYAELPTEVSTQIEQFAAELQTYATGAVVRPTETRVPETSPVPVVEDEQFIPETSPLTDGATILRILQALKERQIERLSQPGWYIYGPQTRDPQDWMNNYYLLTHTHDQSGACDFMTYYVDQDRILPQQLALADGRWGMISTVDGGSITPGKTGEVYWNSGAITSACELANVDSVSYVQDEIDTFQDLVNGTSNGSYKAWTAGMNGRRFFILYSEIMVNGHGRVMDPDTQKLESIERIQKWVYFDIDWGAFLTQESVFFLQNGKTVGVAPSPEKTIDVGFLYYEELPADLQAVYEKMVADLGTELQK